MKFRFLIPAIALIAASSCTPTKLAHQTTKSEPEIVTSASERDDVILYPEGSNLAPRRLPSEIKRKPAANTQQTGTEGQKTKAETSKASKVIRFSESETRDVRVRYNAITDNLKEISLDDLRDDFCYPYPGKLISKYGHRGRSMHTGMDIKATPRDTIRAAFSGTVRMSKPYSGYGNLVVIRHSNGLETVYSHNVQNLVDVNDPVRAGDPVALAGRTGRATTEHLHFETRINGEHFDPALLLDSDSHKLRSGTLRIERRGDRIYASNNSSNTIFDADVRQTAYADITPTAEVAKPTTVAPTAKAESTPATASSAQNSIHKVTKGDTLSNIARRYGTTVTNLCKLNNITKDSILSLGQKIKIK